MRNYSPLLVLVICATLYLVGCGDHSKNDSGPIRPQAGVGRITFSVTWPENSASTRVIPSTTQRIHVDAIQYGAKIGEVSITRQPGQTTASGTLENIPAGSTTLIAQAYDASNNVVASGSTTATVVVGQTVSARLTLQATGGPWDPFQITLTWTQANDIDLHVFYLPNQHSYFAYRSISCGSLDYDDTDGYGPEHFISRYRVPGTYCVAVNYYGNGTQSTNAKVVVDTFTESRTFGWHTMGYPNHNSGYPVRGNTSSWWRVCDIRVYSNGTVTVSYPDTSIPLGSGGGYEYGYGTESWRTRSTPFKPYEPITRGVDPSLRSYVPRRR